MYIDYVSFGSGPNGEDDDIPEVESRNEFNKLVNLLTRYERALAVNALLESESIDLLHGDNTDIFKRPIDTPAISVNECGEATLHQVPRHCMRAMYLLSG